MQDAYGQLLVLPLDHFVFRVGVGVANGFVEIDLNAIAAQVHGAIDVGGDLPADDSVNIAPSSATARAVRHCEWLAR